jgi:uncharacterized PurR-regulated membrane protein YhhQ (DUF165 family)
MTSQLIDSTAIMSILYFSGNLGESVIGISGLIILIFNAYIFKFFAALLDTPLIYALVGILKDLNEDPVGKKETDHPDYSVFIAEPIQVAGIQEVSETEAGI